MVDIFLLGATGSIGSQVLDIIRSGDYRLVTIAFGKNVKRAIEIIDEFKPLYVSCLDEATAKTIASKYPNLQVGCSEEGLIKAATYKGYKAKVINAVVGIAGLKPTIEAIKSDLDVLLANKESLVTGGEIINELLKEHPVKLIPIDSEHSTISKCININDISTIKRIIITASGGAFLDKTREQLKGVTVSEALNHPTWKMGKKITVDCATMVNKGLEVIEAHYLFGLPYDKIATIIHKESIVHSFVEYNDNSMTLEMSKPNMRLPIQYALNLKHNEVVNSEPLELDKLSGLTFQKLDEERYPMLALAYRVGRLKGVMPTVYNAANEAAVNLFLDGKIEFLEIETIINEAVTTTANILNPSLSDILNTDLLVKREIYRKYEV